MEAEVLDDKYGDIIRELYGPARSPEQVARDNWARDVRRKIASCEEAQWMPIAKVNAMGASLPPDVCGGKRKA